MEYPVFNEAKQSIFDVRRRARIRAYCCPGAGLAMLGCYKAAAITYLTAIGGWGSAICTVFYPTTAGFWITVGLLLAAVFFWLGELLTSHSDFIAEAPQAAPAQVWHWIGAGILWSLVVSAIAWATILYGFLKIGSEMTPTLRSGKALLVRRHIETAQLVHGKLIVFRSGARNQRVALGTWMIGRIVGLPGDQLSLRDGRYFVNGSLGRRASRTGEFFTPVPVPDYPESIKVPPDCYFITQDSITHGWDSTVLSWATREELVSTELLELDPLKLLQPISETPKSDPAGYGTDFQSDWRRKPAPQPTTPPELVPPVTLTDR